MKPGLLVLFLVSSPFLASGQINAAIDVVADLEYSYRHLIASGDDGTTSTVIKTRNEKESGKLNGRFGFDYRRKLTRQIFMKSGIRLVSTGYNGEKKTGLRWPSEHDGMGGWKPDPSLPHEIQLIKDFWFVEIPLAGRFVFSDGKFSPFAETGISTMIYLVTKTRTVTDIGSDSEFQQGDQYGFQRMHAALQLSFGMQYTLNERYQLFGQPVFRYHLTKLADTPIKGYLYSLGFEVGLSRMLN